METSTLQKKTNLYFRWGNEEIHKLKSFDLEYKELLTEVLIEILDKIPKRKKYSEIEFCMRNDEKCMKQKLWYLSHEFPYVSIYELSLGIQTFLKEINAWS